jgi:hypothetical protein
MERLTRAQLEQLSNHNLIVPFGPWLAASATYLLHQQHLG